MYIIAETLDDALVSLYPPLIGSSVRVEASRGHTRELAGVLIEITRPRSRLSRSEMRGRGFSCVGELLWYLSGTNSLDFIQHYIRRYADESEDGVSVYGGYGPRLFGAIDQVRNVIDLLSKKPNSRRAVIQLFAPEDLVGSHLEIPCTTTMQFLVREGLLYMITTMRSNDAYIGLPHDVFCFTMLQEILARTLDLELGTYRHFVGSMHLYETDVEDAERYLDEGYQQRIEMPPMPGGDPWPAIQVLLHAEQEIRNGATVVADDLGLDPFWADLVRLLQVFASRSVVEIDDLRKAMAFPKYGTYIAQRRAGIRAPSSK